MTSDPADAKLGKEVVFFCVGSLPNITPQREDNKHARQTTEGGRQMLSSSRRKQHAAKGGRRTASENRGAMNRSAYDASPVNCFTCTSPAHERVQASTTLLTWESAPALPSLPSILSADRAAAAEQFTQQVQAKRRHGPKRRGRNANSGRSRPGPSGVMAAPEAPAPAAAAGDPPPRMNSLPSLHVQHQDEAPTGSSNFTEHVERKHLPDIHTPPGRQQPSKAQEQLTPSLKPAIHVQRSSNASGKAHAAQHSRGLRLPKLSLEEPMIETEWAPLEQLKRMKEEGFNSSRNRRPERLINVGKPANWTTHAHRASARQMPEHAEYRSYDNDVSSYRFHREPHLEPRDPHPMAHAPVFSESTTKASVAHAPETREQVSQEPEIQAPETWASETLETPAPVTSKPVAQEPVVRGPKVQESVTKVSFSEEREAQSPETSEPVSDTPLTQEASHKQQTAAESTMVDAAPANADATSDNATHVDAPSRLPSSEASEDDNTKTPLSPASSRIQPGAEASEHASEYSDEFEFGSEDGEAQENKEAPDEEDDEESPGSMELPPRRASARASLLHFETIDQSKERKVFDELAKDYEILREQLQLAFNMLEYRDVNAEWLEEFAEQVIERKSLLDFKEFEEVVQLYYDRHLDVLSEEFREIDLDNSGAISAGELAVHLEKNGITVVPGIVRELLKEVNAQEGNAGANSDVCTIDGYVYLREIVQYRGGFTLRETEAMNDLFERYDTNGNGYMDLGELESAIKWLGFSLGADTDFKSDHKGAGDLDVHEVKSFELAGMAEDTLQLSVKDLIQGLDISQGGVNAQDFLQVMRRRRECEIKHLSHLFHCKESPSAILSMEDVVDVYQQLGYKTAAATVIEECSKECSVMYSLQEGFYFDDVFVMLQAFKRREGFPRAEIELFKEVFNTVDRNRSGTVDVVELGCIFRLLGIPVSEEEQLQIFDAMDIDGSGEIDFDELLKAMRWFTEDEERTLARAFEEGDEDGNGVLDANEIKCLLPAVGYPKLTSQQAEIVKRETTDKDLTLAACVKMMKQLREHDREEHMKRHGFSEDEMEDLQEQFDEYDPRGTGYIANENLLELLAAAFPEATRSKAGQDALAEHLKSIDENGDGKLEFREFLALMRLLQDREMYERWERELERAKQAGYTLEEMRNYRKVFNICDSDASREVEMDELLRMFGTVVPMTLTFKNKLKDILAEVDEDGNNTLDFCEFLMVMRKADDALKEEPASPKGSSPEEPSSPGEPASPKESASPGDLLKGKETAAALPEPAT